ncbi:MAG: universal stress protein [Thermoanaerobacterales bacterium]|nr:universal stress protein [Bacillota bacterium]MDI6906881.1 universal stress protein [Thermoanaerobacterales bacterium]
MFKVLFATDGSENSIRAARHLCRLAKEHPAMAVTVVHVVDPTHTLAVPAWTNPKEVEQQVEEWARGAMQRTLKVFKEAGVDVESSIVHGKAGETIVEMAKRHGFDQIVLGTRGQTRPHGLVLGTVSQQVMHLTETPLTLVK